MEPISVVILSGGESSRMGVPKACLTIKGKTFVEQIASHMVPADEILLSVKKTEDFPQIPLIHIEDFFPGCGPMAGIHSALIHSRNPLVFVTACDYPFISWQTVEELYSYYQNGEDVVIPVNEYGRYQAVCGLYHRRILPVMEHMLQHGEFRLRNLLDCCRCVKVPEHAFTDHQNKFKNINTIEDYKEVCK